MAALAIPATQEELRELLNDRSKVNQMFAERKFADVIQGFVAAQMRGGEIETQLKEQTAKVLQEAVVEMFGEGGAGRRVLDRPIPVPRTPIKGFRAGAPGAKIDELYKTFERDTPTAAHLEFLSHVWDKNKTPEAVAARDAISRVMAEFSGTVPADGGFLVPETLRATLMDLVLERAMVRPRATVVPMDSKTVPFPTVEGSDHSSNLFGGIEFYWTEEGEDFTESSAKFGRIKLDASKLTGYTEVPNELFTDSIISFEAFLNRVFPIAHAWFEDMSFFHGNGVGKPLGIYDAGNTAAVAITKEVGQDADTVLWQNIVKMFSRMIPSSLSSAIWVCNNDVFYELATMALSVGTGGAPIWLTDGANGSPMSILGRPLYLSEKVPTLGDAGDIAFLDLSYYLIGDRGSMSMTASPHYQFKSDKTSMRWVSRVDGRPWIKTAITPAKGTNTLSPFVWTEARA